MNPTQRAVSHTAVNASPPSQRDRYTPLLLLPLLLVVFALGARGLNMDALWYDEYWSVYDAGGVTGAVGSPADIWLGLAERNPWHAPGYFTLLNGWAGVVGWSPLALRSLSLLVGLLAVAWTYRLGRDLGGWWVGVGAAVTLGGSAFFIYFLHELRGYTLYALLTALTVWAYWRLMFAAPGGRARPHLYVALFLGAVGLLYTHYFAALTLAALGLVHAGVLVWRRAAARRWLAVSGVLLLAGVLFLPWLGVTMQATALIRDDVIRQALAKPPDRIVGKLLFLFSNGSVALLALLGYFALTGRTRRAARRFVWFWLVSVLLLVFGINAWLRIFSEDRYLMALYPALALLAGFGIAGLRRRRVPALLILAVWLGAGVWSTFDRAYIDDAVHPDFWHLPWHQLDALVSDRAMPGDLVAMHLPDVVWRWMHDPLADYYLGDLPVRVDSVESLPGMTDVDYLAQTWRFVDDAPRVWVALDPQQPPARRGLFADALLGRYVHCESAATDAIAVDLYARAPDEPLANRFGSGVSLALLESLPETATGTLGVLLGTAVTESVPVGTYSYGLHVVNAAGDLVAQVDAGLPAESFTCQRVTLDLAGLSPGDYALRVLVYDWQTGDRLVANGERGSSGDSLPLGAFRIEP